MGLAQHQEIPKQQVEKEPWSITRLFPIAAVSSVVKVFTSPFDVLLGVALLSIALVELVGRHASWGFYLLTALLIGASFTERYFRKDEPKKKEKPQ